MSRVNRVNRVSRLNRGGLTWAIVAWLWLVPAGLAGATSVGVSPFSGDAREGVGEALSAALSEGRLDRVLPPAELEAGWVADPEARQIRDWAESHHVDHIVVGSSRFEGDADDAPRGVVMEAELRSGHSGAAVGRYRARAESLAPEGVAAAAQTLATAMLRDLGADARPEPLPPVSATPPADEPAEGDGGLGLGLARKDAPIRIRSKELEVITQDEGRQIVFTDDVVVVQGDIRLETDVLQAHYPAGAAQPDRLVAQGRVRVKQGDRRANCDTATYRRESQTVVCRGHAELRERCDRVRGEEIHFNLETDRVRVLGAPSVVIHPEGTEPVDGCQVGPS
ncbi:MAG: LptA/OstA family protein [Myxococcota bacterium]